MQITLRRPSQTSGRWLSRPKNLCGHVRTNWDSAYSFNIGDRAIDAWEAVADSRANTIPPPRSRLLVEKPLPEGKYKSYGAVQNFLRLRELVLDPRSLLQAQYDAQTLFERSVEVYKPTRVLSRGLMNVVIWPMAISPLEVQASRFVLDFLVFRLCFVPFVFP